MKISQVMKKQVISIGASATLAEAVAKLVDHHVGTLPVVDEDKKLVGVLSLRDVLRLCWPSFVSLMEDYDFVHDFGALERAEIGPELRATPISDVMQEPTKADTETGLLRAAAVMRQHGIRDLPVVDQEGRLVGLASWVDVGTAFLRAQIRHNVA